LCRILLPFLKYAFHLNITFHYCCTHLKFDIFPNLNRQNRDGSKLTRGSSQVNLTLIETETRVQAYFATPFLNFKIFIYISLFLKLTVHSTYTEKLQINEQIKLYTIYTNTINRQMELAGRTNYHIYISNKFT
jgi:hypothetical protein